MVKHILLLFLLPFYCSSQTPYFEKVYGTAGDDVSRSVKQLASGSIYVLGNSNAGTIGADDISLTKLDNAGNELWTMYYGSVNAENGFYLNVTNDGNLVFVGESEVSSNNLDVVIYKVDTAGSVIWNKSFSSPVNENARYIEQTSDGGYIICGAQNDLFGYYDILVLRLDANGDEVWHQTLGRNQNEYSDMIHQVGTNFIVTADTRSYGAGGYDVILYNLDSNGIENWSQTYGDSLQNGCQGLLVLSDGNYLSYGETEIYPSSPFDFYLEKINSSGTSLWRHTFGGIGNDALFSVKEDTDGGFVCTGYSNSYNGIAPIDLIVLKTDSTGNVQWNETYGGSGIDIGYEIIPTVDNSGFIITGKTSDSTDQYYLLKVNRNGLVGVMSSASPATSFLDVYPNPVKESIFVNYNLQPGKKYEITFSDIFGNTLRKESFISDQEVYKAGVSELPAGVYFISLSSEGNFIRAGKFVKM